MFKQFHVVYSQNLHHCTVWACLSWKFSTGCSIKPAVCVQCSGVLPNVLSQRTILTLAHRVLKTSNAIDELSVLL